MRAIRRLLPNAVWLITNRCELEQFLLLPSTKMNELIGAWLGRALYLYGDGIEVFGFIFLSNHFHLLVRDTKGQLAEVMRYFQTNVAKAVNRELGRPRGRVFAKRYSADLVEGNDKFLEKYAYVLGNAVKPGLVEHALDWPGLSSLCAALNGTTMRFQMLDRTAYHKITRRNKKVDPAEYMKTYEIEPAVPPMWKNLSKSERRSQIETLIAGFERLHSIDSSGGKRRFLGTQAVLAQKPTDRPLNPSFEPRAYILCSDKERRKELFEDWRRVSVRYRACFEMFAKASAKGRPFNCEWPPYTCPPSRSTPTGYSEAA